MKINDIYALSPIDKRAAVVVSKGFEYEPEKKITDNESSFPLPTRPLSKFDFSGAAFKDLTGFKFGRMRVVGKSSETAGWVVKCSCGRYTTRKGKSITNPNNDWDCCHHCRHVLHLKREDIFRRTGKRVHYTDL